MHFAQVQKSLSICFLQRSPPAEAVPETQLLYSYCSNVAYVMFSGELIVLIVAKYILLADDMKSGP